MSYRLTKKAEAQRHRLEAMRRGKVAARMERPIEARAPEMPALRRQIMGFTKMYEINNWVATL